MLKYLSLNRTLSALSILFIIFAVPLIYAADTQTVLIGYQGEPNTSSEKGSKRGILEANLQGEFLGVEYKLIPLGEMSTNNAQRPRVIIVASSDDEVLRLASKYSNVPVINILSSSDRIRAVCMPNLFHTMPSQQMFSDALAQWRTKNPESNAAVQAWHKTFRKYAAAQLNSRYRETYNVDMDDDAWAGWAATKLVADTLIRTPALADDAFIAELKTNLGFDGQKGIDMNFRETGQLAQPLLLIENDKILGEAPVRGVVKITDLDSLGVTRCPK